jgi:DNA-binding winged helix-turn-helix (wHTH) protein
MFKIGRLHVSLLTRSIRVDGQPVRLGSRAFDILELLMLAQGEVVTLDQITKTIWPRTVVVENNIRVHIVAIRKLLDGDRELLITVPGRGYRLVSPEAGYDERQSSRAERVHRPFRTSEQWLQVSLPMFGREAAMESGDSSFDYPDSVLSQPASLDA